MPQLLVEKFFIDFTSLNESSNSYIKALDNGRFEVRMKGQAVNKRNRNKRVYPPHVLIPQISEGSAFYRKMKRRRAVGQVEHPQSGRSEMDKGAILVTDVSLPDDNDDIYVTFETLSTVPGRVVEAYIRDRVSFGISSRGEGSLAPQGEGFVVQSDFVLKTWDTVLDESTIGAEINPSEVMSESVTASKASKLLLEDRKATLDSAGGVEAKAQELALSETLKALSVCVGDKCLVKESDSNKGSVSEFLFTCKDGTGHYRAYKEGLGWMVYLKLANSTSIRVTEVPVQTLMDARRAAEAHMAHAMRTVPADASNSTSYVSEKRKRYFSIVVEASKKAQNYVSDKISSLKKEGKPQDQAVAIALSMAGKKGYKVGKQNESADFVGAVPKRGFNMVVAFDDQKDCDSAKKSLISAGFHVECHEEDPRMIVHTDYTDPGAAISHIRRILVNAGHEMREAVVHESTWVSRDYSYPDKAHQRVSGNVHTAPEADRTSGEKEADGEGNKPKCACANESQEIVEMSYDELKRERDESMRAASDMREMYNKMSRMAETAEQMMASMRKMQAEMSNKYGATESPGSVSYPDSPDMKTYADARKELALQQEKVKAMEAELRAYKAQEKSCREQDDEEEPVENYGSAVILDDPEDIDLDLDINDPFLDLDNADSGDAYVTMSTDTGFPGMSESRPVVISKKLSEGSELRVKFGKTGLAEEVARVKDGKTSTVTVKIPEGVQRVAMSEERLLRTVDAIAEGYENRSKKMVSEALTSQFEGMIPPGGVSYPQGAAKIPQGELGAAQFDADSLRGGNLEKKKKGVQGDVQSGKSAKASSPTGVKEKSKEDDVEEKKKEDDVEEKKKSDDEVEEKKKDDVEEKKKSDDDIEEKKKSDDDEVEEKKKEDSEAIKENAILRKRLAQLQEAMNAQAIEKRCDELIAENSLLKPFRAKLLESTSVVAVEKQAADFVAIIGEAVRLTPSDAAKSPKPVTESAESKLMLTPARTTKTTLSESTESPHKRYRKRKQKRNR